MKKRCAGQVSASTTCGFGLALSGFHNEADRSGDDAPDDERDYDLRPDGDPCGLDEELIF